MLVVSQLPIKPSIPVFNQIKTTDRQPAAIVVAATFTTFFFFNQQQLSSTTSLIFQQERKESTLDSSYLVHTCFAELLCTPIYRVKTSCGNLSNFFLNR